MNQFTEKELTKIKDSIPSNSIIISAEKLKIKDSWDKNWFRAKVTFIQNGIRKRTTLSYQGGACNKNLVY